MKWFLTMIVIALPLLMIWQIFLGLLVKPFGVDLPVLPLPIKEFSAAVRALTKWEYIVVEGALGWGGGTWLLRVATDIISARLHFGPGWHESASSLVSGLAIFMVGGIGWGWMMWN